MVEKNKNIAELEMVDISSKNSTFRTATAQAEVKLPKQIIKLIIENKIPKGNVLNIAQIAGFMAAKNAWNVIPMCHLINIDFVNIEFVVKTNKIIIKSTVKAFAKTGVEMEAIHSASIAAITIYDMCKSIYKGIEITKIKLLKKEGGKSGIYINDSKRMKR